jgi:hypothetical protein
VPAYEIRYLKKDGSLAARFFATCATDDDAKKLAHAIQLEGARQMAVWDGQRLLYTRPLSGLMNATAPIYSPTDFSQAAAFALG